MLKFPVLLACGLLMVAGCSGSGGGGNPLEDALGAVESDEIAAAAGVAAKRAPISGSVTQSANDDTINVDIANFGEASATFTVSNTRSGGEWSLDSDDVTGTVDGDLLFAGAAGTGTVYVGLVVEPNIGEDEDYLAYGLWANVPETGDPEIGVFVDSNDNARFTAANILALTGTATYAGQAFGIYSDLEDEEGEVSSFTGAVALSADFGANDAPGTISGTISSLRDIHDNVYEDSTINLGAAPITVPTGEPGFFTGATTSTVTIDGSEELFSGQWGGQFFVNGEEDTDHPENVAGTFGLANVDNTRSFLGLFLAQQPDGGS